MSIKCSILGHRFDETAVEREREEDGSEVVITITELETCDRCGETRVVSENKEVTTMKTPDEGVDRAADVGSDEDADDAEFEYDPEADDAEILGSDADSAARSAADSASGETASADEGDAQTAARSSATIPDAEDDATRGTGGTADVEADAGTPTDDGAEVTADASGPDAGGRAGGTADVDVREDDDAVIMSGESETGESETGESETGESETDESEIDASETDAWVDDEGDAVETDAGTVETADQGAGEWPDDDSVAPNIGTANHSDAAVEAGEADAGSPGASGAAGESFGAGGTTGEWPEETTRAADVADEAMDDWPEETKRDAPGDAGAAGPTLEESASPTITVPEGMFKCSECSHTTEVESSSLRAGDFCPECHRGTLVQHEDADEE